MQQRSEEWFEARRGKLTGSNIGAALGVNPYKTPDDLIRQMVREYHGAEPEFTGNIATDYGTKHEPLALMDYLAKTGNLVEECGFIPHPDYEWLGASPDGLIDDDGLIEVKCPYGQRAAKPPVFKSISEQQHYYAQVQIELQCTQRQWCDFYQWAPAGDDVVQIHRSDNWFAENLPKLEAFYDRFLKEVSNPAHLEPLKIRLDTDQARTLVAQYDALCEQEKEAKAAKQEVLDQLSKMAKGRDAIIGDRLLTEVERKGNVDYKKVPELKGVDLEPYRKAPSKFWKLS